MHACTMSYFNDFLHAVLSWVALSEDTPLVLHELPRQFSCPWPSTCSWCKDNLSITNTHFLLLWEKFNKAELGTMLCTHSNIMVKVYYIIKVYYCLWLTAILAIAHWKGEFQATRGELVCGPMPQTVVDPHSFLVGVSSIMELNVAYVYMYASWNHDQCNGKCNECHRLVIN